MKNFVIAMTWIYHLLIGVLFVFFTIMAFMAPPVKVVSGMTTKQMMTASLMLNGIEAVWLIATALGLFKRKNWARISLLIMSGLALSAALVMIPSMLFILQSFQEQLSQKDIPWHVLQGFAIGFLIIFFVVIPSFFIYFFNKKSVKAVFIPEQERLSLSPIPFGVKLISISYFMSIFGTFYSIAAITNYPLIGNIFISGALFKIYTVISTAIAVFIAIGLWQLKKSAWYAFIIYNGLMIFKYAVDLLTITEETIARMMPQEFTANAQFSVGMFKMILIFSLLVPVGLSIYIYKRKNLFFGKKKSAIS